MFQCFTKVGPRMVRTIASCQTLDPKTLYETLYI